MARRSYRVPFQRPKEAIVQAVTELVDIVRLQLMQGKVNSALDVTLSSGTSTTITSPFIHENSVILLMPKSSAAGSVLSGHYITPGDETATITHSTAAGTETASCLIMG